MITVIPVSSKKELRQFIDLPHSLYAGDKNYVPELFIAQRDMLNPQRKHPFHEHGELQLFLALKNGRVCGRVAAIVNKNHIRQTGEQEGFFGFFDVEEDYEIANSLLQEGMKWLRSKQMRAVIGPVNFSTNDPCGLLIDGFDGPPRVMMTYNKPFYKDFLEQFGFQKRMDLFSYWFTDQTIPERILSLAKNIETRLNRSGITIRTVNMKNFAQEASNLKRIYNGAWDKNWGFVPMTDKEFDYLAKDLKLVLDKDLLFIAEKNGQPIAFALALPNINEILVDVKRGRLFPSGLMKLLFNKGKIKSLRVLTLGVLEEYRMLGIEACFYTKIVETARLKGYHGADASWILENNEMMNRELLNINSKVYKTHRLYNLQLN